MSLWNVRYRNSSHGLQEVILEHSVERTSCSILLHGCTISSWVVKGSERLFMSSKAILDGSKAIRGGIPVVFPQFAQPLASMPQHGLARTAQFEEVTHEFGEHSVTAVFSLQDDEETRRQWPHKFKLEYCVSLSGDSLTCELRAKNTGSEKFQAHTLLHTYIRIPSIETTTVTGFYGKTYIDKVRGNCESVEDSARCIIDKEVDRVYMGKTSSEPLGPILVESTGTAAAAGSKFTPLTVSVSAELDSSACTGLTVPHDIVLWNPWIDKSRALMDLGDEDYHHFVCVEPGTVADWVDVPPGATLTLTQTLTVAEA